MINYQYINTSPTDCLVPGADASSCRVVRGSLFLFSWTRPNAAKRWTDLTRDCRQKVTDPIPNIWVLYVSWVQQWSCQQGTICIRAWFRGKHWKIFISRSCNVSRGKKRSSDEDGGCRRNFEVCEHNLGSVKSEILVVQATRDSSPAWVTSLNSSTLHDRDSWIEWGVREQHRIHRHQ